MQKLTPAQKQEITGGFAIAASAIKAVHGVLTVAWVGLETLNLISDHLPKHVSTPKHEIPLKFENNLISSRITISS